MGALATIHLANLTIIHTHNLRTHPKEVPLVSIVITNFTHDLGNNFPPYSTFQGEITSTKIYVGNSLLKYMETWKCPPGGAFKGQGTLLHVVVR